MRRARFAWAAVLALGLFISTGTSALAANPPGNNGTVKVDGVNVDKHPNANEPHVGCDFSLEWYGFDANAVSTVTFDTHPPTSSRELLTDIVQLDNDDNSGGGSPAGLDGVAFYTLQFDSQLDYLHPMQGYHVYLTINTTGAQGSDVKHKVFWVTGCGEGPPPA